MAPVRPSKNQLIKFTLDNGAVMEMTVGKTLPFAFSVRPCEGSLEKI